MKRVDLTKQRDEGVGAPTDLEDGASGASAVPERSSGVYARSDRPPRDDAPLPGVTALVEEPCCTVADVCPRHTVFVWERIQRQGVPKDDVKDVFQKVFLAAHRWTRDKPKPRSMTALLATLADNQVTDHMRALRRREGRLEPEVDADTLPSSKPGPEQLAERAEARQKVETILGQMPHVLSTVFRVIEVDGQSPAEAAESLGRLVGTVNVQLHRARASFWALAKKLYNVDPGDWK